MPVGAIAQLSVDPRRRPGVPGMAVDGGPKHDVHLTNSDPQAAELYTLVIDTATNSATYGLNLTDPATSSVTYTADASATKIEIAAGLVAAWNVEPMTRMVAPAVSDGVDTVTFTADAEGVPFAMEEDESASLMTLTNTTNAAEADTVPFGRAMISTSYVTDYSQAYGIIAKSTALTAQADTWTISYDAGIEISAVIEVEGVTYRSVPFAMATNLATVTAALDAAIDAAVPANTVIASNSATTTVITSELAGKAFTSSIVLGVGSTGTAVLASNKSPSTDFNAVFAGISLETSDYQQLAIATEAAEYAKNAGVTARRLGNLYVTNTQTIVNYSDVYVELDGTGSDAGKFYNDSSATRVLVTPGKCRWLQGDHSGSDANVAKLRIDLGA